MPTTEENNAGWYNVGAAYDKVADRYNERFRRELEDKPADRALLDGLPKGLVVDLGCGPGHVGTYLCERGSIVFGLDVSHSMTRIAAESLHGCVTGTMLDLPFRNESVDAITAFYSVIHVPRTSLSRIFAEFRRVLKPNGRALVSAHEGDGQVTVHSFLEEPVTLSAIFTTIDELVASATDAGLRPTQLVRREPYPSEGQTVRLYVEAERPA